MKLRTLKLTDAVCTQLDRVARAQELYPDETHGYALVEIEQLRLAELVLEALAQQEARARRLPDRAVPVVVEVSLRPKRKRA